MNGEEAMDIDENGFFRKATLRICSSLDIEIAMCRAMQFLKDFIPADGMYLHLRARGADYGWSIDLPQVDILKKGNSKRNGFLKDQGGHYVRTG